jgi:DNA topoisomerase-1
VNGCGGELVERVSKRNRRFYGCSRYPACKAAFWNRPVGEHCPQCDSPVLLEKTTKKQGIKWICPNPDCKYERAVEDQAEVPLKTSGGSI